MNENAAPQDATLNPAKWNELQQGMAAALNGLVLRRLVEDEQRLHKALQQQYELSQKVKRGDVPPYTVAQEIATNICTNTRAIAPDLHKTVEDERDAVLITDLLALLTPQRNDPKWKDYSPEECKAIEALRDSDELKQLLKHERYMEEQGGTASDLPPIEERLEKWIKEGHAKEAVRYGKYAVMAGMIIASPPMAAGMAATWVFRRRVLPHVQAATTKLQTATERFLVENNVLSQAQVDQGRHQLDQTIKRITGSKIGRFSLALASVVSVGAVSMLATDVVMGDELGTRLGNLWDATKSLTGHLPADGIEMGEQTNEAEQGAAAAELTEEVMAASPSLDTLAHPNGGVYRDALAERLSAGGHPAIAEYVLALESEQLDLQAIRDTASMLDPRASMIVPERLEMVAAQHFNIDLSGVVEAAQTPIVEPSANTLTTPSVLEGDSAALPEAEETGPIIVNVAHTVEVGDTLSEAIYDAYRAEGIKLTGAELYGPSAYTSHPGGIVGEIADKNGYSNPDLIFPGQTISIDVHTMPSPEVTRPPAADLAATPADAGDAPPRPQISPEARSVALSIAAEAQLAAERQAAELAVQESVVTTPNRSVWSSALAGAAGMVGLTAAVAGIKNYLDRKKSAADGAEEKLIPEPLKQLPAPAKRLEHDPGMAWKIPPTPLDGSASGEKVARGGNTVELTQTYKSQGPCDDSPMPCKSEASMTPAASAAPTKDRGISTQPSESHVIYDNSASL